MKIIKNIGLFILIILFLFMLWMNITPGHFQLVCCNVEYRKSKTWGACITFCGPKTQNQLLIEKILIKISDFDLYK